MEGRAPQATVRPGNPVRKRGRGLWVVAALVAALLAIGLWMAFARSGNDDTLDAYSQAPESPVPSAAPPAGNDGAAMIVDAGGTAGNEAATATGASLSTDAAAAPAGAATAAPGTVASVPVAGTAPAAKARTPHAQARTAQKKGNDDDLLGTLLGIIKQEEKNAPKQESMDSLINRIRAEDQRNTADANAAFDSIDKSKGKARASTQSEIQVQLRRCPNANTLAGIECRRKVCASLGGKDPACPAP